MIESKVFVFTKDGSSMLKTERSWKVMKKSESRDVHSAMVCQIAGGLSKGLKKGFLNYFKEGTRSFIVQRCTHGRYMALVEYGASGRCNFIVIPEEDSMEWRKMADAL